jgi:hypothetical protein
MWVYQQVGRIKQMLSYYTNNPSQYITDSQGRPLPAEIQQQLQGIVVELEKLEHYTRGRQI